MNRLNKFLIISVAISIGVILAILALTTDVDSMKYISHASPFFVLLAFAAHFLSILTISLKLKLLARSIGYRITVKKAIEITLASGFLAAITPSQMGGEPLRIKMLADDVGGGNATALVFAERIMDVIFFVTAAPAIFILFGGMIMIGNPYLYIAGGALFVFLIWLVIWVGVIRPQILKRLARWLLMRLSSKERAKIERVLRKIEREIDNFSSGFKTLVKKRAYFTAGILLTALLWMFDFAVPCLLMMAFGIQPAWMYAIFAQILITLIALIPLTPGASGVYELSALAFFTRLVPLSIIGIFIFLWRLSTYYFNLVVGGMVSINVIKNYGREEDGD